MRGFLFFIFILFMTASATFAQKGGPMADAEYDKHGKTYPQAEAVSLPPVEPGNSSVRAAIESRRSRRRFAGAPLALSHISALTFSAQGVTGREHGRALRAAPSAGALYPVEVYVLVQNVADLSEGLYHYRPEDHALERIRTDRPEADLAPGQPWVQKAPAVLMLAAVPGRVQSKYGRRGRRYVHMEIGHVSENIYLTAESRELATVIVGAFDEEAARNYLGLEEGREDVFALHPVGLQAQ